MNNDLISRSELKKEIERLKQNAEEWVNHTELDITTALAKIKIYELFIDIIDNAPTVIVDSCGKCPYYGDDDRNLITEAFNDGYNTAREKFERPQGEWIEKVERRGCFAGDKTVYSYTCPFCGVTEFKKYPFCHCGADMRR